MKDRHGFIFFDKVSGCQAGDKKTGLCKGEIDHVQGMERNMGLNVW